MGRRKQANRAEAIVRGVGAIFMLVVLLIMVQVAPKALQGKDVGQMLTALLQMLFGLALLGGLITVLGLIVWFKVLKGHKKGRPPEQTKPR